MAGGHSTQLKNLTHPPTPGGNQVIQYDTPKFSNFKIKEVVLPEKYIRVSDQIMFLEVIERSEARKSLCLCTQAQKSNETNKHFGPRKVAPPPTLMVAAMVPIFP